MPRFRYRALNSDQQPVSGEVDADSVAQAVGQLESSGLAVQSIGFATSEISFVDNTANTNTAAHAGESPFTADVEQLVLTRHMATVIERGRAIVPALKAYAQEMPAGRRRQNLTAVIDTLDRGDPAAATAALRAMPTYWIPLLSAATATRDGGRILQAFLQESRRAEELRRQWWLTLAYPLVIVCATAAVMALLSFLLVPIYRQMFLEFGLRLPWLTRFVLELSAWITSGRILIAAGLVLLAMWVLWQAHVLVPLSIRNWIDDRLGTLPGRSTAIARFSQFSADLLEAELETPSVLRIAGFAVQSSRVRRAAWRLARDIDAGAETEQSSYRPFLTATVLHALRGDLPVASRIRLLREVSRGYAERAGRLLSWTRGVVEPLAICTIGLIVGAYVLALFLPLFMLIQGLAS